MRVVVLSPAGVFDTGSLPSLADVEVSVVSWSGANAPDATNVVLPGSTGPRNRVIAVAQRSVIGRVLLRLTPLDPAVVFWRATTASDAARAAIRSADLLVAPERDGIYAAWRWCRIGRRAGTPINAVFGYPAARAALEGNTG